MKKALLALMLCLSCGTAAAKDLNPDSARGMYEAAKLQANYTYAAKLSDDQKTQMAYSMGWFSGALKSMEAFGAFNADQKFICPAKDTTVNDVAREYVAYVDAQRGELPDDPMVVLVEALKQKYPCK